MANFDLFLDIRNILTVGKHAEDDNAFRPDDLTPKNEDIMYAMFAQHWLPAWRSFLSVKWQPRGLETF